MRAYTGHNKHLNRQVGETMEDYNERLGKWEDKTRECEWSKITAYEEMLEIIRGGNEA